MKFDALRDEAFRLINSVLSATSQSELDLLGLLKICVESVEAEGSETDGGQGNGLRTGAHPPRPTRRDGRGFEPR